MNICVVGTGYVGLVTGAVFADLGNDVVCVDKVHAKIDSLKAGRMPIYEPGLEEMVARNVADGRLSFTTELPAAVRQSDVIFIAVGTPPRESGETDLSHVEAVAAELRTRTPLLRHLRGPACRATTSTVLRTSRSTRLATSSWPTGWATTIAS